MSEWVVLFLIAVVISPLAWLVPSRRQLGSMEVRLQARRIGLSMQLSRQDWPHWLERSVPAACAQYYRVRSAARNEQWCFWQIESGTWLDKWREPCGDPDLLEQLRQLPVDVYKAEAGVQLVAVYWGEKGGTQELQRIHDFLLKWI
jgi:hypothetical protein